MRHAARQPDGVNIALEDVEGDEPFCGSTFASTSRPLM